ncbi:MAG TPA: class I SAM-dependent methyltransferase [Candidatus Anoxymicrobiaceae bacterium]
MIKRRKRMTFDTVTDTGGKLDRMRNTPKFEFVREYVDGADVLNIGCWTGAFESLVADSAARVTAVDIEPCALEVASRNVPGARFEEASVLSLPFEDSSFDLVTMWETLEHLPEGSEPKALTEIARVLKPGGRFALSTPSAHLLSRLLDPAWFVAGHRHYSAPDVTSLLTGAGLAVERMESRGSLAVVADYMCLYIWKWILRRPMPERDSFTRAFLKSYSRRGFVTLFAVASRSK